jgi:HK97 family phage portal protein
MRSRTEKRDVSLSDPAAAELFGGYGITTAGGTPVNPRTAEQLSVVLACVSQIASAIASLPAIVYKTAPRGRIEDLTNPLNRLIRNGPNGSQTWPDFIEWLVASTLLTGNGLSEIISDARGAVVGLNPIPWNWVSVQLLPTGGLAYDVSSYVGLYGSLYGTTGRVRRLLADEVIHLRDRSDDGLIGRSRLQRAAATIGNGLSLQEFSASLWRNSANPSGALQAENKISDASLARLKELFRQTFSGSNNAAKALVLDQGLKWQQISVSPEDAEVLQSRRFSAEEIARIYGVPPPLVGIWDRSTFTNSETAGRWFAQHCLVPWCTKIEAEFSRSLFSSGASAIELDVSGSFLRGDPAQRWEGYQVARQFGILTVNEIRDSEGFDPVEGGDVLGGPPQPAPAG